MKPALVTIASLFLIGGCGNHANRASQGKSIQPLTGGTWKLPCSRRNGNYAEDAVKMTASLLEITNRAFARPGCTGSPDFTARLVLSVTLGRRSSVPGATDIDATFQSVELAAVDPLWAQFFRDRKFCGRADWIAGQFRDVSGRTCGDNQMPRVGDRRYDIIAPLPGGSILLGDRSRPYDGTTREKRPRALDRSKVYQPSAP